MLTQSSNFSYRTSLYENVASTIEATYNIFMVTDFSN